MTDIKLWKEKSHCHDPSLQNWPSKLNQNCNGESKRERECVCVCVREREKERQKK